LMKRILVLVVVLWASLNLSSCGGSKTNGTASGLPNRVLASQGVSSTGRFGGLVFINGQNDTLARVSEISTGTSPGMMAMSPTRNIATVFDPISNSVYAVNTTTESNLGKVQLPGTTSSMVVPTADPIGYAAVPTASVTGFPFLGGVEAMNFSGQGVTTTIAVTNAQSLISNATGSQLLVFNGTNSVFVLAPGNALPLLDTSCYSGNRDPQNPVCTEVKGFDQPVFGIINGSTAYILNCGAECAGSRASVQTLDLSTFAVGAPLYVNGATYGFLNGSTLYVAGKGTPTGPLCSSITSAAKTAATYCGTLDIVDLKSMTDTSFTNPFAIPDGYHNHMDLSVNGQLFIGSRGCTNIGNVNNPSGEVRGCLAIFNITKNSVIFPPDNGDVNGLQSFTRRNVEYVAEGGNLRVYDTAKDALLVNDFVPQGTINVVGYVGDVKAIDFF
jgi:hypothetical protein